MADRKYIEAGKAHVTIYAKDSPLMKGLAAVSGKMNAWGAGIMRVGSVVAGIGAGITAAFIPAIAKFAEMGGELDDISQRTGVAVSS